MSRITTTLRIHWIVTSIVLLVFLVLSDAAVAVSTQRQTLTVTVAETLVCAVVPRPPAAALYGAAPETLCATNTDSIITIVRQWIDSGTVDDRVIPLP